MDRGQTDWQWTDRQMERWTHGWTEGRIDRWMVKITDGRTDVGKDDGWMNRQMDGRMDGQMDGRKDGLAVLWA